MNKIQEGTTLMLGNISTYLPKKTAITALLPGFPPVFTRFNAYLTEIYTIRDRLAVDIKTLTAKKKKMRSSLITKTQSIGSKTEVYAAINSLPELVQAVHYAKSTLAKMSDADLLGAAFTVYDKSNANIASLATYFVLPATLIEFKAIIDTYKVLINTTAVSGAERVTLTAKLASLIASANAELETIDKLVKLLDTSQPDFCTEYNNTRRTKAAPTSSYMVMAAFTDAATKKSIKGVKTVFVFQPDKTKSAAKSVEPLIKKSADKGSFRIKNMPEGVYTVTISKAGYATQVITIEVTKNEKVTLNIKLELLDTSTNK